MLSVKDILEALQNKWKLICFITLLCSVVGAAFTYVMEKPQFTATASLYVLNDAQRTSGSLSSSELSVSKQLVETYLVILKSDTTMAKVTQQLEVQGYHIEGQRLLDMLSAGSINNTEAFYVSITCDDPNLAAIIVNTIIKIVPSEIIRVVESGSVKIIDYAKVPTNAYFPVAKNTLLGGFGGLIIITIIILLVRIFDTIIHDEQLLKDNFNLPVLGQIPIIDDKYSERYDFHAK